MRRGVIGAVVLVAVAFVLSGCGKPSGVDGDLVNGWALPAEPAIPVPSAEVCYNVETDDPTQVSTWPDSVDCTAQHTDETIYVGQFEGSAAERDSPPLAGGEERLAAYSQCSTVAAEYLGGDWRTGRLDLVLVVPIELHWDAGARWYRCDVVEYQDLTDFVIAARTSSVKDGLSTSSGLVLTCASVAATGDTIDSILPAECSSSHNAEFTGIYDHPEGEYPSDSDVRSEANLAGCRSVIAAYTGIPDDADFQYRVGQVASPFWKASWELGNRGVRCYVWVSENITSSVKGVGTSGLPINYA